MAIQETSFPMEGAATPPAVMDPNRWRHQKSCSKCIPAGYLQLWFMFSWSSIWRILNHGGKGCQTSHMLYFSTFQARWVSQSCVRRASHVARAQGVSAFALQGSTCAKCLSISLSLPNNFRLGLPTWPLAIWEKWIWNAKWLMVSWSEWYGECVFSGTWCWGVDGAQPSFHASSLVFMVFAQPWPPLPFLCLVNPHHYLKVSPDAHVELNTHPHLLPELLS